MCKIRRGFMCKIYGFPCLQNMCLPCVQILINTTLSDYYDYYKLR